MDLEPRHAASLDFQLRWPLAFGYEAWKYRSVTVPESWGRHWTVGLGPLVVDVSVFRNMSV